MTLRAFLCVVPLRRKLGVGTLELLLLISIVSAGLLHFKTALHDKGGDHFLSLQAPGIDYPTYQKMVAPDLAVSQRASPNPVLTGSSVTYTITVTNLRSAAAPYVTLSNNLPSTVSFVSCSSTLGGICGGRDNNRTVTFASIAGTATAIVTLVAQVKCPVVNGASISNTAVVSSLPPDADPSNDSATALILASNPPPRMSAVSIDKPVLWPPNRQMVAVTVNYNVADHCGIDACALTVSSNEPNNGTSEWEIVDAHHVLLRAERNGHGSGRVYTITIRCTNSANNSSVRTVTVTVPHHQN